MAGHLPPSTFQLPAVDSSQITTYKGSHLANAPTIGVAFTPISPFRQRATSSNPAISGATTAVQASTEDSRSESDSSSDADSSSADSSDEESTSEEGDESSAEASADEGDEAPDREPYSSDIEEVIPQGANPDVAGDHAAGDSDSNSDTDSDTDEDDNADAGRNEIDGELIFESDHEPSPEYDRVANHGFAQQNDHDLEPPQILSDILAAPQVVGDLAVINTKQPAAAATPTTKAATTITANAPPSSTVPQKRKHGGEWDEARRKRVSQALKQRWADGKMAHVADILRKNNALRLNQPQATKEPQAAKAKPATQRAPEEADHKLISGHEIAAGAFGPTGVTSIDIAASGRAYRQWEENGVPCSTHGAILPDGYQPVEGFLPWKCPVRQCVKFAESLHNLGQHFKSSHHSHMFHDYQDGTLFDLGPWTKKMMQKAGPKGRVAIVVSMEKSPVQVDDSVQLDESMESDKAPSVSADSSVQVQEQSMELGRISRPSSSSEPVGDRATMWAYIEPLLVKHRGQAMPRGGYVWDLSILPRVRDLKINFEWQQKRPFMDTQPRDISAVIIQVTGEPAATPCDKCKEGRGPWKGCIMISSKAASQPLANIYSCANCFYHFGQTYCSHKSWGLERSQRILRSRGTSISHIQGLTRHNLGQSKPRGSRSSDMSTPNLPSESALATSHHQDKPEFDSHPSSSAVMSGLPLTEDQKALWNYIKPHLAFTKDVPDVGYIKELLSLPRIRDLDLNPNEPFREKHTRDIAALIIQITGDELDPPCTRCRREQGPLYKGGCVAINTRAYGEARRIYQGCANCTYDSKAGACSRGKAIPQRPQPPYPPKLAGDTKPSDGAWLKRAGGGGSRPATSTAVQRPRQTAPAAVKASKSLISAGDIQAADQLDMEEWEMGPGRILEPNTTKPTSFAYSKPFLVNAGHAVPVVNDIQFQVKTVYPGQTITLEPVDVYTTRMVAIATGKVRVKKGDAPEFLIGQSGVVVIDPGSKCTFENVVYVDATLHITYLSGFY